MLQRNIISVRSRCLLFGVSLLSTSLISAQDNDLSYKEMDETAESYGYSWKPYVVETEDGWLLTVFRITAVDGVELSQSEENIDKPPVFM